eukprot:1550890-Rhodomonas_salina.2
MEEFANFALGLHPKLALTLRLCQGGWIVTFAVGIAAPYAGPIRANFIKVFISLPFIAFNFVTMAFERTAFQVSKEESIVEMTEWSVHPPSKPSRQPSSAPRQRVVVLFIFLPPRALPLAPPFFQSCPDHTTHLSLAGRGFETRSRASTRVR